MGLSRLISLSGNMLWVQLLREGLLIIGWVAMWRPLEILLYDRWTLRHHQQILRKLSQIEIEIRLV